jgi:thiamine biosynthesis lipoprotein
VGFAKVELRAEPPALRKRSDVYVDLSAIAKGYGVDRVAERLQAQACTDYMVEIGGEVRVRGLNPRGQPWRIGIEVPDPASVGKIHRVVSLEAMAVATSGDYRNYVERDGMRLSHTIDPRSGEPVGHSLASVTVVHGSALWADAYATAINVLGVDAGWAFAKQENLAVLFIMRGANGFEERYNSAMESFLLR